MLKKNHIALLVWSLLFGPFGLFAQANLEDTFLYGDRDWEGTITYRVEYHPANSEFQQLGSQFLREKKGLNIEFRDLKSGMLQLTIVRIDLKKRHESEFKLVIPQKCIIGSENLQLLHSGAIESTITDGLLDSPNSRQFQFRVIENGYGSISLRFGIIPKEEADITNFHCNTGAILLDFNITGLIEKPKPVVINQDSLAFHNNNSTLSGLVSYLNQYPNGQYNLAAKDRIKGIEEELWLEAERSNTSGSYRDYLNTMDPYPSFAIHSKEAENRLARFAANKEESAYWQSSVAQNTIEAYQNYLDRYPGGQFESSARMRILALQPMDIEFIVNQPGYKEIKFGNTNRLRYKDLSPDFGLQIIDSRLRSDSILIISYESQGIFKLFVEDDWGKKKEFSFSNELIANMTYSSDSTQLQFSIDGGKRPYKINLIDHLSKEVVYTMDQVSSPDSRIWIDSLRAKGIAGIIRSEVWDADGLRATYPDLTIKIDPVSRFGFNWILIISIAIGILAVWLIALMVKHLRNFNTGQ